MLTLKDFKEETSELGTYLVKESDGFRLVLQPCMSGYCIGLHNSINQPVQATICTSQPKGEFEHEISNIKLALDIATDVWETRHDA
jgi:hypothetical protein